MKVLCSLMMIMILRQAIAGIVRKPPAFSTSVYSNSYLPAAMQVIFHAVEQLKLLQAEKILQLELVTSSSISTTQSMKKQQPQSTTPEGISIISTATTAKVHEERTEISIISTPIISTSTLTNEISSQSSSKTYDNSTEVAQRLATSTASVVSDHKETPEVNQETTETNYELPATPETNHESPESVQEIPESNQEVTENEKSSNLSITEHSFGKVSTQIQTQQQASITQVSDFQKTKKPTVDSVVDEIHRIVKTTTSLFSDESDDSDESKSVETSIEKSEKIEEEEEETRFCLLGERVAQVPRPSLNHYLRRSKVPPRPSLQQMANLYDALSKDARKQGFARFAGYTDEILKILYSSAEGGIGPQLKQLLKKVVEKNELTRDDAKLRTSQALRDLDNPASALSMDLRRLLPLRYTF
ncbi:hypothetical protein ALC56_11009 [Trachymyrmex septentrionalis]|uniref:Uncharacterized protein n=1 Tax=Trachymyrmex septentrionalis TaxID=34720 RepID=A0A195F2W7_9HYME|nr:PREDICTED: uncharacterized protein LOC108752485 [Trachymyrmex septentrionalis]KYN34522.1 hypothetical protein ALC56_11009 [Trachymyrmex septentrionalis]